MVHVVEAHVEEGSTVWVRFSDGTEGRVDVSAELHGPVFEPLKDRTNFQAMVVDPELGTIVWPNGADFAPEFLYDRVRRAAA